MLNIHSDDAVPRARHRCVPVGLFVGHAPRHHHDAVEVGVLQRVCAKPISHGLTRLERPRQRISVDHDLLQASDYVVGGRFGEEWQPLVVVVALVDETHDRKQVRVEHTLNHHYRRPVLVKTPSEVVCVVGDGPPSLVGWRGHHELVDPLDAGHPVVEPLDSVLVQHFPVRPCHAQPLQLRPQVGPSPSRAAVVGGAVLWGSVMAV
mmetsp:Transcript_31466/g.77946  ORF Transcript_31466/g.77946 Transcript_31466/m.77946 type:complete len:206 (-) Transcript_31466:1003-1620(-)